jgi:GT2 family glycosyltransferase
MTRHKVYIILVNWNGWQMTLNCLESLFRLEYPFYQVVVCDNGSEDGSLERIRLWATQFNLPTTPVLTRTEAESGQIAPEMLTLIQTGGNLGFAGGANIAMRYAMARNDYDAVWLLNNDTQVDPNALTHLVRRLQQKPEAGLCGSTLLWPDGKVQALGGGRYRPWLGITLDIGRHQAHQPMQPSEVEPRLHYINGASMLVSRRFLETVGLMREEYFLYYEEVDWAYRGKQQGFQLAYAPDSIVYHLEGGSQGGNARELLKSEPCDYYSLKNRLRFSRRFYPHCQLTVYLGLLLSLINRIRRRQWTRLPMIINICLESFQPQFLTGQAPVRANGNGRLSQC